MDTIADSNVNGTDSKTKNIQLEIIKATDLQGKVLKQRYMISHPLDEGAFGNIYECIDLNKPKHNYVIKISDNYQMLGKEIQALADLRKQEKNSGCTYPYDYVPKCVTKGMFLYDQTPESTVADTSSLNSKGEAVSSKNQH